MRNAKTGMSEFKVNGRTYKFDILTPMDAISFGSRVLKAAGGALLSICGEASSVNYKAIADALSSVDPEELSSLMREALNRVYTPEQEPLKNEAVFNAWFNKYPEDLFVAGVMAVFEQVRDFFPFGLSTLKPDSSL